MGIGSRPADNRSPGALYAYVRELHFQWRNLPVSLLKHESPLKTLAL